MSSIERVVHAERAASPRTVGTPPGELEEVNRPRSSPAWRSWQVPRPVRRLLPVVLILVLWQLVCWAGVLPASVFPAPLPVLHSFLQLSANGTLQENLAVSLQRVLIGLALGVSGGLVLAVLAGIARRSEDFIDSTMQLLKAVPHVALIPLFIIWMGIGEQPKIALIALGVGIAVYINTYSAIRGVDDQLVEAARTLGVSRLSLVLNVILPGSLPGFLVGLRLALPAAWLSLIFAETVNAQSGIGFLMQEAEAQFNMPEVVMLIVLYAVIGLLGYSLVRFLERRLLVWRRGYTGQ